MNAMQNSPHYAYFSEISALLSNMVAVCMDSSSNLCPVIRQTCLACSLAFGLPNMLPAIQRKRYDPLSLPCALDSSTMELLVQFYGAFKEESHSLQRVIKDIFDGASPEVRPLVVTYLSVSVEAFNSRITRKAPQQQQCRFSTMYAFAVVRGCCQSTFGNFGSTFSHSVKWRTSGIISLQFTTCWWNYCFC